MKKRKNKITDSGFVSENGVSFGSDITFNYTTDHSDRQFYFLRLIIAFLATLSVMCMFGSFIEILPNYSGIIAFSAISVISISMIKSRMTAFRYAGFALIAAVLVYFALSYEKISQGFFVTVYQYLRHANQPSSILGGSLNGVDKELYPYLAYIFIMFLTTIVGIIISVSCIIKLDFPLLFIVTFPLFELGMYWGWEPPVITLLTLFLCWVAILTLHSINHTTNKAGRNNTFAVHERKRTYYFTSENEKSRFYPVLLKYVLILSASIFALIILFIKITGYERSDEINTYRRNISNAINNFTLDDISNAFSDYDGGLNLFGVKSVGGTNGGVLGRTAGISFNGSTSLQVTTGNFEQTMYLRGYVAGKYEDNCWNVIDYNQSEPFAEDFDSLSIWPQDFDYYILSNSNLENGTLSDSLTNATGKPFPNISSIDVNVKNASKKFVYAPYAAYYSDSDQINEYKMKSQFESYVKLGKTQYSISYCNLDDILSDSWTDVTSLWQYDIEKSNLTRDYEEFITQNYTQTAESEGLENAYNEICDKYLGDDRSFLGVYNAISNYFNDNYVYSLNPGVTPDGEDFVNYFLTTQKKGYCTYFATAGAMLMRKFGFPARYVEGYMVLPTQYNTNLADENGEYQITVKDKSAHAWTEVYLDGLGWYPAEFTPGYHNDNPNLTEEEKNPSEKPVQTTIVTKPDASEVISDNSSQTETSASDTSSVETTVNDSSETSEKADSSNSAASNDSQLSSGTNSSNGSQSVKRENSSENAQSQISKTSIHALLFVTIIFISFIAFMTLRRSILLKEKERKCSEQSNTECAKAILHYTLSYLSLIGIKTNKNLSDMQICDLLTKMLNKKNINIDEQLELLFELAEKAYLSNTDITDEEIAVARKTMNFIADEVVRPKLNWLHLISAKYGNGLY